MPVVRRVVATTGGGRVKKKTAVPPLPKYLWSPLGDVRVRQVKRLRPLSREVPSDVDDFGQYDPKHRAITVLRSLEPWVKWQTLWHEWVHMVLFDAGSHNHLSPEQVEVLCDVIGTALVGQMRSGEGLTGRP